MSFLRGGSSAPSGGVNIDKIELAVTELDTVTDFFNRMVQSCHSKCISTRYAEGDLNKGESVCIDRCVAKFNDVQKKVGEKLQSRGAANAASGAGGGFSPI
ncbi:Tim10/DDP family zinc finger-domain-containing protein [Crepidotus variabilis]|uniref:Mitochondrial import inner membrane translocase subunit n=1 Tax=Crepidotus variabilis TaxID=179855 RepID=A0A9P6EUZ4_9AGAR|nr:Tim10/DDP family zinc finger-domain-containing protein [Crepidotus variabilis]